MSGGGRIRVSTSPDVARATITLYAGKGNAITADLAGMIDVALDELGSNRHLKLLVIEAAAADFSFGASIPEHAPGEIERALPMLHALITKLLSFPAPTAALIRGRCLGGGFEVALACDFIFAEAGAVFGLPEIALGVFPPAASALLPLRIGAARATSAILTGAISTAVEFEKAGLISFVSRAGELAADVDRWFDDHIVPRSAAALRHAAAALRMRLRQDVLALLPQLERLYLDTLMHTEDAREGIAAFLDKRPPKWTDR